MKKCLLFICLVVFWSACNNTQVEEQKVPTKKANVNAVTNHLDITLSTSNKLYIGVDNLAKVHPQASINHQGSALVITKGEKKGEWFLRPNHPGLYPVVLSHESDKKTVLLKANYLPDPVSYLEDRSDDGKLRVEDFKSMTNLYAIIENFEWYNACSIHHFSIWYLDRGTGKSETIKNEGSAFGEAAMLFLKKAKSGDVVVFEQVKAFCPGEEKPRKLNSLVFHLE